MRASPSPETALTDPHPRARPRRAGIGLRADHDEHLLRERPELGLLEVHTENFFHEGGLALQRLDRLRRHYPLSLHGVGLGLGSIEPLDAAHLARVRRAVRRFEPELVSEHACWSRWEGRHFNDLLPLPYTEEAVRHIAQRIRQVQETLERTLLIENISQYLRFEHSALGEGEYLAAIVAESDCRLLLDLNNLYVNEVNLGANAREALAQLPQDSVAQFHVSGHLRRIVGDGQALLIDDHGSRVCDEVWALFEQAVQRFGPQPTIVEWDTNLPAVTTLIEEARRADAFESALRADAR